MLHVAAAAIMPELDGDIRRFLTGLRQTCALSHTPQADDGLTFTRMRPRRRIVIHDSSDSDESHGRSRRLPLVRSRDGSAPAESPSSSDDDDAPLVNRRRSHRRTRFIAEADEDNVADSDGDADESDHDAAAMYRDAILGLRNRPNALREQHANTMPCAVCRQFARFLRSFLS